MNVKVKVPSNSSSAMNNKQKGVAHTGQPNMKVSGQKSQGLSIGQQPTGQAVNASGGATASIQHPSHAKKLTEGKQMTGSRAGLGQHKYNNSTSGGQNNLNMHVDMAKKSAFEISRNNIGSRGRSLGAAQSPNGTAPRRNIQQFQLEQQQQLNSGMMVQAFDSNAVNTSQQQPQISLGNGKASRNQRANSTMPGRPSQQQPFAPPHQFAFENAKGPQGQVKGTKFAANPGGNYSQANTPLSGAQGPLPGQTGSLPANGQNANTLKRIRDSRQRGNKSMQGVVSGDAGQNQLMQAYINQTVTMNQKTPDFAGPSGQIRATEPMRIRAHSDLKKTGIQIGVKIQGIQNSREHLNQTTVLAGNPQNSSLTQGIQQFHSRGNSINGTNMGMGIPGQNQKRSQSVDKNAPHFHQYSQPPAFAQSAHFGPSPNMQNASQSVQVTGNQGVNSQAGKDPKSQHYIHEAIERKIERFSRQRNRGGLNMSQGAPNNNGQGPSANSVQSVYTQNMSGQFSNGKQITGGAGRQLNGANSKGNIQTSGANVGQPASRAFKAQQKMQQQLTVEEQQALYERQKKKAGQPGTAGGQNQLMMRSEIMSAGQANVPQRKILTANQAMQPDGKGNMADEPTGTRNNYLTNMLDGYQNNNVQKKVQRGGTRGVSQAASNSNGFPQQPGSQGVPTGPLLAQKVVQLPNQQRTGKQTAQNTESDEQKVYRNGKIKLDRLKKEPDSPSKTKSGKLTIIEVDHHQPGNAGKEQRNKTKIAAAIHLQQRHIKQQTEEEKKQETQNPQLQGSQGAQIANNKNAGSPTTRKKDKIAVISLTTAKIDVRSPLDGGEVHSEKQTMEPDEQAQLQGSKKRLAHQSPESSRSQPDDYEQYNMRTQMRDGKKSRKTGQQPVKSHRTGASNGSMAVSMRDESIMHMSVNSVTDGNFILHEGDAQSHDSNDHFSIKKQMIRYLSRVADRNKPLFVFNQKINLGGDSSDDDTGTPSFSLVALIEK